MRYPNERFMTLASGQPVPAKLVNALMDETVRGTHGTRTQRYRVANRRVLSGAWNISQATSTGVGTIAESANNVACQFDFDPPPTTCILSRFSMKVKDGGAGHLLQLQLIGSRDDGVNDVVLATAVSTGSGALEVVGADIVVPFPGPGISATLDYRLYVLGTTTGGGTAQARRLYEFALSYYRP